jgi:hypothetical protein
VPAQIREYHAIASRQSLGYRQPKFMICRERMQENYSRAGAQLAVNDFGVAALYLLKGEGLHP